MNAIPLYQTNNCRFNKVIHCACNLDFKWKSDGWPTEKKVALQMLIVLMNELGSCFLCDLAVGNIHNSD